MYNGQFSLGFEVQVRSLQGQDKNNAIKHKQERYSSIHHFCLLGGVITEIASANKMKWRPSKKSKLGK
jgi:hypothetical protein